MFSSFESISTVEVLCASDISPVLDETIREGLVECYPEDREHFSRQRSWHSSPDWIVVARTATGTVAAHLAIVERRITVGDNAVPVTVAGIQGVFVRPPWRKTGLIDRIMEAALDESHSRGLDAGLLFCLPVLAEKVYRRLGWLPLETTVFMTNHDDRRAPIPGKNITMTIPLCLASFPFGSIDLCGQDW